MRASCTASQLVSVRRTEKPASTSSRATWRDTELAPRIRNPEGGGSPTPSTLTMGRDSRLWTTTVPMMTRKVIGTSISAPSMPWDSSLRANSEATAAATMPRGESQASRAFSRSVSPLPRVHSQTVRGRATHINTARKIHAGHDSRDSCSTVRRPASSRNSPEISRTVRVSLNSMICWVGTPRMLASHTPITVTVSRPDSWNRVLEMANSPSITIRVPKLCSFCGSQK